MLNHAGRHGSLGTPVYGLLILFAVLGVDMAATRTVDGTPWALLSTGIYVALAVILRLLIKSSPRTNTQAPPIHHFGVRIAVFTLAMAPLWLQTGEGRLQFAPHPMEVVWLSVLRNLMLALAVFARSSSDQHRVMALSLLLVCCATMLADHPGIDLVLLVYLFTAACWLLARALQKSQSASSTPVWAGIPKAPLAAILLLIVACTGLGRLGPKRTLGMLGQWVASSGGNLGFRVNAREGVGDGADSAGTGEAADSTGFSDGDTFRESKLPSLYDVMTEVYGDPQPPEVLERTIALSPRKVKFKKGHEVSDSGQAGRRFALLRRHQKSRRHLKDLHADALFYVEGRTPLHLRSEVFSHFDGVEWYGSSLAETTSPGVKMTEGCWMHPIKGAADGGHDNTTEHKIKIGTLASSVIPIPAHVKCFRVGLVDEPGFFKWHEQGILHMIRSIPTTTVIDVHTCISGLDRSLSTASVQQAPSQRDSGVGGNVFVDRQVALLAREWTDDVPQGWDQIEAIITHLRRNCRLNENYAPPGEPFAQDPTRDFLEHTRSGRDYDFASAAAVMLTALGYEARMAGGYYVDPDHFDSRSNHTPVHASDIHFWCEVRATNDAWLIVESTPGYAVLQPKVPWHQRMASLMHALRTALRRHAIPVTGGVLALLCLWWQWRRVWNIVLTAIWYVRVYLRPDRAALATIGLLDARSRLAGDSRPPGCTPSRWYMAAPLPDMGLSRESLHTLIRTAEAQLFGAKSYRFGIARPDVHRCCGIVAKQWTVRRLRDRSASQEGKTL